MGLNTIHFSRIFPDPAKIRATRAKNVDTITDFRRLTEEATRAIKLWTNPEIEAFARVDTRNRRAAEMLVDALREDGYAADFHWHGDEHDKTVVQFAFDEADLQRCHHDPRR